MTKGDCPYLQQMSQYVENGFAFAIKTYSSDNTDWLQGEGTCTETCSAEATLNAFSKFMFWTEYKNGGPTPPLDWTQYRYGEICSDEQMNQEDSECLRS